jgi:hypothetical protein
MRRDRSFHQLEYMFDSMGCEVTDVVSIVVTQSTMRNALYAMDGSWSANPYIASLEAGLREAYEGNPEADLRIGMQ